MSIIAVLITVAMSIVTAIMLEFATHVSDRMNAVVFMIIVAVLVINIAKFWLWGWIHKRYDLSKTYPIGALFFPLIYLIAWWQGETNLELGKLVGIALVVTGVVLLQRKEGQRKA